MKHLLWAVPLLLVLAVTVDLTRDAGIGIAGPDGEWFRVRRGSWVPLVTGSTCTTIGETIHCRRVRLSGYLLAHEFRHVEQQRGRFVPLWLVRYWVTAGDSLEADAHRHGCLHRGEHFWVRRGQLLSPREPVEVSTPAEAIITCEGIE